MHFRITSIAGQEEAPRMRKATAELASHLNATLGEVPFGSDLTEFSIVFVFTVDDPAERERWANKNSFLGRRTQSPAGQPARSLSIGVSLDRPEMKYLEGGALLAYLTTAVSRALEAPPSRVARGLDYAALASRVRHSLEAAARGAA